MRAIAHQEQKLAQRDDTPTHTIQRAGERGVKNPSSCVVPLAVCPEAYEHATTVQARGAVMLGDEMIDEASRKMAEVIVARGNAAGYAEIPKATE